MLLQLLFCHGIFSQLLVENGALKVDIVLFAGAVDCEAGCGSESSTKNFFMRLSFFIHRYSRTLGGRRRRRASAAELLHRVHSHIQVDVFTAASVINHLLFLQSHLESVLFRAELQALVDEDVEVTLTDNGGHLGPKFSRNDRSLHSGALHSGCVCHSLLHCSGYGL